MRKIAVLVTIIALSGCSDTVVPLSPDMAGPHFAAEAPQGAGKRGGGKDTTSVGTNTCDPMTAVEYCDEPVGGGGGAMYFWSNEYFGTEDYSLYEAPGDPNPGSAGVWLGADVTPGACFNPSAAYDSDSDGLHNTCESVIARAFAPLLAFDDDEVCSGGEPHWAAKFFSNGAVRIAYMPTYYDDCGYKYNPDSRGDAHRGDSEMITVEVVFNSGTRHWEFLRMWTSAHYGVTYPYRGDASRWNSVDMTQFPVRSRAFPKVFVARDKHANYNTISFCEDHIVLWYWGATTSFEDCSDAGRKVRFPVLEHRNVGSPAAPKPCARSETTGRNQDPYYRAECFFVPSTSFRGWYTYQDGEHDPKSYRAMLTAEDHFEYY